MLTFLDPRFWLALIIALAGAYGAGRWHQYKSDAASHTQATLKATEQARAKEQEWQLIYKETADAKEANLRALAAERDTLLVSLRDRPARVPGAASAPGANATGARLYREDAEFLAREAARADELRAALDACQRREAALAPLSGK